MNTPLFHVRRLFGTLDTIRNMRSVAHTLESFVLRDAWHSAVLDAIDAALMHFRPIAARDGLTYTWRLYCEMASYTEVRPGHLRLMVMEHELAIELGVQPASVETLLRRIACVACVTTERCSSSQTHNRTAWLCGVDTNARAVQSLEQQLCQGCVACVCARRRLSMLRDARIDHERGLLTPPALPSQHSEQERAVLQRRLHTLRRPVERGWVSVRGQPLSLSDLELGHVRCMWPSEQDRVVARLRALAREEQRIGPLQRRTSIELRSSSVDRGV